MQGLPHEGEGRAMLPNDPSRQQQLRHRSPPHLASRASFAPLLRIRSYLPQARMGKDPMRAVFDQRRGINWQRQRHDRSCVGFAVPGAVGPKCLPGAAAACCWCSGYGWTTGVCLRVVSPLGRPPCLARARAIASGSNAALPSTLLVSVAFYEPKWL